MNPSTEDSDAPGDAMAYADFELPMSAVTKLIKGKQPGFAVSKNARQVFSQAAGVFITYITAAANEFAREAKRSSMNDKDVLRALFWQPPPPEEKSALSLFRRHGSLLRPLANKLRGALKRLPPKQA